jgi:hypothetical protein
VLLAEPYVTLVFDFLSGDFLSSLESANVETVATFTAFVQRYGRRRMAVNVRRINSSSPNDAQTRARRG